MGKFFSWTCAFAVVVLFWFAPLSRQMFTSRLADWRDHTLVVLIVFGACSGWGVRGDGVRGDVHELRERLRKKLEDDTL